MVDKTQIIWQFNWNAKVCLLVFCRNECFRQTINLILARYVFLKFLNEIFEELLI